jgi:integrase
MRGSIQRKGKTFYAVIPLSGRRVWYKGGTKRDAERVLAERLSEINQGTYQESSKKTFKKFSDLWLKSYAQANLKASTFLSYQDIIERLLDPTWGHLRLSNLTTGNLQRYVSERLKTVSPKTVINEIVVIKEMFKHAYRWGYIWRNPAEHLERPKLIRPEIEILNPEEVDKLLAKASNHYRLAFQTCVLTGLRAGELWGLRWSDIDWNSWQLHIRQSLWKGQFQTPKSKYSVRRVDIPEQLAHELKKWKLASPKNEQDLAFPSPEGKPTCHDNMIKRHFDPALRRAGLRHVSFHSLRHTNASMRIQAGQNIKYIQTQLGHSSIKVTLDIYGHLFNDINFNRQQVRLLEISLESVRNSSDSTEKVELPAAYSG